jgi:hypothetical protein
MGNDLRDRLKIPTSRVREINEIFVDPSMQVTGDFLQVVEKYGTPGEINAKARKAGSLSSLVARVRLWTSDALCRDASSRSAR